MGPSDMMTKTEMHVWIVAFSSNHPRDTVMENGRETGTERAAYWAACAVFSLRGAGHPSDEQIKALLEQARAHNLRPGAA